MPFGHQPEGDDGRHRRAREGHGRVVPAERGEEDPAYPGRAEDAGGRRLPAGRAPLALAGQEPLRRVQRPERRDRWYAEGHEGRDGRRLEEHGGGRGAGGGEIVGMLKAMKDEMAGDLKSTVAAEEQA